MGLVNPDYNPGWGRSHWRQIWVESGLEPSGYSLAQAIPPTSVCGLDLFCLTLLMKFSKISAKQKY